jgi:4-aminobutyrate aminotransferase-like enzyme
MVILLKYYCRTILPLGDHSNEELPMSSFPGPNTQAMLPRGLPLFRNGLRYEAEAKTAQAKGYVEPAQIIVDRAAGDFLWDIDGKRYIDLQNGWATNPLGNAHPEIIEAVHAAHKRYGFHYDHPLRYDLAEKLAETMPGKALPRFNFEVSGTEAAEAAVHLALCYTKRRYIIAFSGAFHGEGLGTKLISGYDGSKNRYMEAWTGGVIRAPFPFSENIPAGMNEEQYAEYCLWFLDNHIPDSVAPRDSIAGILIEPGLAEGGNWIPQQSFMKGIRKICDKNDWLMIADEVLTGMGRTGKMWAVNHYDLVPDILVVGKNLSGGIEPCAGIAARDDILGDNPQSSSGSTFAGTPAGCAAGLKTLELYERENLVERAASLGEIANSRIKQWEKYGIVSQARGSGLLLGVNFKNDNPDEEDWFMARAVRSRMLANGAWAICDREDTIRMYPALNMAPEVLNEALDIMEEAIGYVDRHGHTEGDHPAWPTGVAGF